MPLLDDFFFSSSNGGDGSTFMSINSDYNEAKRQLVNRYNAGKSIDYSDPGVQKVLNTFGASNVEILRYKSDI